jgi:4-amino-4-deoxy-L-arabinose transferase-like glycosyltransferase
LLAEPPAYSRAVTIGTLPTIVVLLFSLTALGLRFVHLEADFPYQINWSGDLYTDEGWYSNNAVAHALTGRWIIEGDFNPIVSLPVFPLAQAAAFSLLGVSLTTARITEVVFSILVCLLSYRLVTRMAGGLAGLATLFLLSTSFTVFAFSRLAILELPMTALTLVSLLLAISTRGSKELSLALASLAFCLAALTKTTALFGLPSLLYLIWTAQPTGRKGFLAASAALALIALLLGAYYAVASGEDPNSVALFTTTEFTPRLEWTLPSIVWALGRTVWNGLVLDRLAYPLTMLSLPLLLIVSKRARRDRLVLACTLWIAISFAALAVRGYLPPRYYLPLSVPLACLLGVMAVEAVSNLRPSRAAYLPLVLVAGIGAVNLIGIVRHLASPQFSFVEMAWDVEAQIEAHGGNPLLIGNIANSVSLATGLASINSELGTRDLPWKLEKYRPGYYLALGEEKPTVRELSDTYELQELATYDVFGNYYNGKPVQLYKLNLRP